MFGISDDQTDNQPGQPAGADVPPMPPSPFLDSNNSAAAMPPAMPSQAQSPAPAPVDSGLATIKEQALTNLAPLVGHLDQTPEERFKTTMMLIQASDNSALIKDAYEAANKIQDEKAKAQALLDVVNEINYFTQKDKQA